jgi:RNA recognition motif-containing protein
MDMFYKERLRLSDSQRLERRVTHDQQTGFKLFVGGLNKSTSEEVLFQYFSQFGDVNHAELVVSSTNKSKGYSYVILELAEMMKNEIEIEKA